MSMSIKSSKLETKQLGRLDRIPIPRYTLGEELISSIWHGVGAVLGIASLCRCLVQSYQNWDTWDVVSSWIFGISLVVLYSMSCIYHGLKPNRAKKVMRIFDHCTIFLLIAGTYTPFTLVALRKSVGWWLFAVVWGAAIVGIILNAIDMERFKKISMVCYLAMGWVVILAFEPLREAVPLAGIQLLVAGGVAYTLGAIIYGVGSKVKYMHSLWHFFVLAGSILHFFTIYLYVI